MADYINMGANVVAYEKDNKKYAMTCAWCMQCDYEELLLLIGSQSITGKHLQVNDIVGISSLSSNQMDIASHYGENHSDTYDKFKGQKYHKENSAILIDGAKVKMVCKINDISHVKGNDEDLLVHVKILKADVAENLKFLARSDMR